MPMSVVGFLMPARLLSKKQVRMCFFNRIVKDFLFSVSFAGLVESLGNNDPDQESHLGKDCNLYIPITNNTIFLILLFLVI